MPASFWIFCSFGFVLVLCLAIDGARRDRAKRRRRCKARIAELERELGLEYPAWTWPGRQPSFEGEGLIFTGRRMAFPPSAEDVEADHARRNIQRMIHRHGRRHGLSRREVEALTRAFADDDR